MTVYADFRHLPLPDAIEAAFDVVRADLDRQGIKWHAETPIDVPDAPDDDVPEPEDDKVPETDPEAEPESGEDTDA